MVNGKTVDFHEIDESGDIPRIRFHLDNTWRSVLDFIVPNVTALAFILRIHLHGSDPEKLTGFWSRELPEMASKSEVKRWLKNSAIRFNGRTLKPEELLDFPLYSVVLFPKGNRVTIL
jgi:23S rRNA-/tRNA-specific pseudouridylate synthase